MRAAGVIGRWAAAIGSAAVVLAATAAVGVLGPVIRIKGPEDQRHPSADATHLIWTQNSERRPLVDHAYGKVRGEEDRFRLDATGTRGAAGGIEPDGARAAYQQMTATTSDLYWFTFDSRTRRRIAFDGVNTDRWERDPRVSAAFLLFARDARNATTIHLWDRDAGTVERIASYDIERFYVAPGAIGERYATWTTCGPLTCTAWWYDTEAVDPAPKKLPADGRQQYAPAIDEVGGFVYAVRSGDACGASVGIWRRPWPLDPGQPAVRLVLLRGGIDTGYTLSLDRSPGNRVDLWFSRYRCASDQGDVAVLRDVETGP